MPSATSATPAIEIPAAAQKRVVSRSSPASDENAAAKIGVVPRTSETVVAVASFSE